MSDEYYNKARYMIPKSDEQVKSAYDQESAQFQDLVGRNQQPVFVETINLNSAGEKTLQVEGYHFVLYGHDGSANKAVNSTVYANAYVNARTPTGATPFPAKHARGFSGPFNILTLTWPAQTGLFADLIIYKGDHKPWIDGESAT